MWKRNASRMTASTLKCFVTYGKTTNGMAKVAQREMLRTTQ